MSANRFVRFDSSAKPRPAHIPPDFSLAFTVRFGLVLGDGKYRAFPLISPNLAPQVTTITFPDGYQDIFYDQISISSVSHTVA
jgi:hypothetical protein